VQSKVIRNIDALSFSKVPYNMSVTVVTTIVRCAVAVEGTISELREIVNGITANVNDNIYTFRQVQHVGTLRKIEDEDICLSIEASRCGSLNLSPSAAASCIQDGIRRGLSLSVSTVSFGNHSGLSLTKADRDSLNDVVRVRIECVVCAMDVRDRRNFEVTTESVQSFEVELTCNNQLGKTSLTRSCIAGSKGEITECGISSYCKSTCGVMALTATYLKVTKAE
jgi:hypothetical protein